jgi:hypothetical protein
MSDNQPVTVHPYSVLHKYFAMAVLNEQLFMKLAHEDETEERGIGYYEQIDASLALWYASLYTVIEGWRHERIKHQPITMLLRNKRCVDILRNFRNFVFHYSPDYEDTRATKARDDHEFVEWLNSLYYEIGRYLASVWTISTPES